MCNCCYLSLSHSCGITKTCCICLTDMDDRSICSTLPCGHIIHRKCYVQLGNSNHNNCSLCRSTIRKVLICDLCNMNMLDRGYATMITRLYCNHIFHNGCITISCSDNIIQVTCPKCGYLSTKTK